MRVSSRVTGGLFAASILSSVAVAQNPAPAPRPAAPMSFFISSVGKGDGANLGGLVGADAHCAQLAAASGAATDATRQWRAYLSGVAADGKPIHARERIGAGPWHNAKGAMIAASVPDLHGDIIRDRNQINKLNAITENGQTVHGVGDTPNIHDILTGSDHEGRALPGTLDTTCGNWTSNAATGSAMVGHHDRTGGGSTSWNAAHASRGCGQQNLVSTGGAGLLYCFAAN
ncbi:MAG: lectin [Gemmatimonadaceae bacterium]